MTRKNNCGAFLSAIGGLAGLFLCCLSGCTVGPDYQTPETRMPDAFVAVTASNPDAEKPGQKVIDAAAWWKSLDDPELDALIDRAIKNNLDLVITLDRMQEARTQEDVVMGNALPEVGASIGGGAGTGSDLGRGRASQALVSSEDTGELQQVTHLAGFDSAWELDIFGQYRRELEAAKYDTQAAIAARNNVLISVIADVARAYIVLRARQMQRAVLQKNADNLNGYVNLAQERYNRGITNELDLALAQRQLATLEAHKAPLEAQIHAAQYVIAVLVGEFPENMTQELNKPGLIPGLPDKIETGIPPDLLKRRPDIQEAEREVAGATARIGVAEADLFPHISLLGSAGIQGEGLGSKLASGFIWSIGPSVDWALLDFDALDALVEKADLRAKEMLAQYKRTVLNAVREVDTSFDAYKGQQDRLTKLEEALTASQKSVSLATERYNRGLTDALNVIDAERQEYDLEDQYVAAQEDAAEQFIGFYKALGGGWEKYQSFPPIRQPKPAVIAAFASFFESHDPQNSQDFK
jgi:NodT family efflux transporter outer membrane factor (OMF) lipoprotein